MNAGKQALAPQDTVKVFKQDLLARGYSARTAEVYATAVAAFLKSVPNPAGPAPEDADRYIRGILDGTSKGGASQSSVGIAASAIKLLYKHQLGRPLELSVELKRRARPMPSILSKDEIQKIVTVTRNVSHRLIFQLMYSSGLKLDELLGLKVKDVEIEQKRLTIRGNAKSGRKAKSSRETILSDKIAPMLHAFVSDRDPEDHVFPGIEGGPMTPRAVQKAFKQALKKAEIKKRASCNSLRHSFAVHLLQKGTDIKHVRRLLGHARTETTSIYKRFITEEVVKIKSPLDL
ncbi:MAG: tyrosine-type recombinase/integrase [bacterium]